MPGVNIELLKRVNETFTTGNTEELMSLLAPDITVREAESLPYAGTYQGREDFMQLLKKMAQTWEYFRVEPERYFEQGEQVMAVVRLRARARATGEEIDMPMAELWTFSNGKVAGIQPFYFDTARVARATTPARSADRAP